MDFFKVVILSVTLASLAACSTNQSTSPSKRDGSASISQFQAQERAKVISDVNYQLTYNLTGDSRFSATTKVTFNLSSTSKAITLDLNKADISRFVVNGTKIYPSYNGAYITINASLLSSGENIIEVDFSREHSTNGEGLHRFVDPVDGKVYLYSHFEPAAAQQMFAVFDQPDLKANYLLSVIAPADWQVVSTMRETSIEARGATNLWQFPLTPKLSPYNFSMHAGPYHVWQDDTAAYPMRLFARQSVASQVAPEDWFTYTRQGLAFFDRYFGINYPFKKYDQLLVPDFLYGAMENAGAITFSENYFLTSAPMTAQQKESLASVIMHEMAHQWFGNLVTMKWWNGLWLNESFASFMGTLATSEATEFHHAWRTFYAKGKQKAYHQDSLVTSHAIEVPVATTANAFDNIDAITYQKGASTLKQLRHLLGDEMFRQGVSQYLTKYSYQNAQLSDFIDSLADAGNRDLSRWTKEWLYSAGVNSLKVQFQCSGNQISQFALIQSVPGPEFPTLREQKVQVALFNKGRHYLEQQQVVAVTYKGRFTKVPELIGEICPDLVYPNFDDWGFVKVQLDDKSFQTAKQQLSNVHDPLLRSMLWQSLWDNVVDGKTGLDQFINVALVNAPLEQDYTILGQVIANLHQAMDYLNAMAPSQKNYTDKVAKAFSQMSLRRAMESHKDSDFQRRWFDAYVAFSHNGAALSHLSQLLDGKVKVQGLTLGQDLRWDIIRQLNRFDFPQSLQRLQAEKRRDNSDSGEKAAIAAEVIRPEAALKRRWLNTIENNEHMPFSKIRVAMENLYPSEQQLFSAATAEQRLANLPYTDSKGPVFMRSYGTTLIPTSCSYAGISALDQVLNTNTSLSALTRRAVLEARQEEHRCVRIKAQMSN
ncbi:aminopeptidase N [Shewanella sp.]|uniref:aminopeptidase N n=1 Tax=Shewanella sp. TaxID=50422 RepID=UPI0040537FE8